jgi:hypothetical protein
MGKVTERSVALSRVEVTELQLTPFIPSLSREGKPSEARRGELITTIMKLNSFL